MKNRNVPLTLLDIIKNGYFQQVRFLVDHDADLDQRDCERRTALMLCAFVEPEDWGVGICRLLIENGAQLNCKDKYGLNAFQYAVIYERVDLVKVYLKAIDFSLNAVDRQGNTALHYAVRSGNANITRLIAQAFVKYRISFDKRNNAGLTAMQEAIRGHKRKCVRVLENSETLADVTSIEANIPLDLKSVDYEHEASSFKGSKKSLARPRSSIMSRRSSKSSLLSSEYSYRRSPTIYNYESNRTIRQRDKDTDIPPHEKNHKNLIRCASMADFRNSPEYLFQMLPLDPTSGSEPPPKRIGRAKSAFVRRSEVESDILPRASWRTEFRKLYLNFQYQCTSSYRETAVCQQALLDMSLPSLDKPMTPANSEHGIDDLDRNKKARVKSAAVNRQATEENLLNPAGKGGRQVSKSSSRKISQNVGHGGKISSAVDASLESSNESINSSVSSKKQADGKISKPAKENSVGRQSRTANHETVSTTSLAEEAMKLKAISE